MVVLARPSFPVVSVTVRVTKCSPSVRVAAPSRPPSVSGVLSSPSMAPSISLAHWTVRSATSSSVSDTVPSKVMSWSE